MSLGVMRYIEKFPNDPETNLLTQLNRAALGAIGGRGVVSLCAYPGLVHLDGRIALIFIELSLIWIISKNVG